MQRLSSFNADVQATPLVGLSTASSAPVVATDTHLIAIGKLQAQATAAPTTTSVSRTSIVNALIFG